MNQVDNNSLARVIIGELSLIMPHKTISTVELTSSIEQCEQENTKNNVKNLRLKAFNTEWPVVSLDPQLTPLPTIPEYQRFVACINPNNQNNQFALTCEGIESIQYEEHELKQLPPLMRTNLSPIIGVLYKNNRLHCITNADLLSRYLLNQQQAFQPKEAASC